MNITGKYMMAWKVSDQGKYKFVDLGDSYKKDGNYENFTWFGAVFVGEAGKKPLKDKTKIHVTNGIIYKEKGSDGKYYDKVIVFDFEYCEQRQSQPTRQQEEVFQGFAMTDSDIPFIY